MHQADALARGGLCGQGDVGGGEDCRKVHVDESRHIEDDGAWPLDMLEPVDERARRLVVSEVGDVVHRAAAPAPCKAAIALGTREGHLPWPEVPHIGLILVAVGIHLSYHPVVGVHRIELVDGEGGVGEKPHVGHGILALTEEEVVPHGLGGWGPRQRHLAAVAVGMTVVVGG